MTLDEFAILVRPFCFIALKHLLNYLAFQSFGFERHLMKDLPETRCAHYIWCLRFHLNMSCVLSIIYQIAVHQQSVLCLVQKGYLKINGKFNRKRHEWTMQNDRILYKLYNNSHNQENNYLGLTNTLNGFALVMILGCELNIDLHIYLDYQRCCYDRRVILIISMPNICVFECYITRQWYPKEKPNNLDL